SPAYPGWLESTRFCRPRGQQTAASGRRTTQHLLGSVRTVLHAERPVEAFVKAVRGPPARKERLSALRRSRQTQLDVVIEVKLGLSRSGRAPQDVACVGV